MPGASFAYDYTKVLHSVYPAIEKNVKSNDNYKKYPLVDYLNRKKIRVKNLGVSLSL